MKAALAAAAGALVLAAAATAASPRIITPHPGLPYHPQGSVVGEGLPLKAYAGISPSVHLFGDTIHAKLSVIADTRWVDTARLRARAGFAPYTIVAEPTVLHLRIGRFEQMTWTWTLRCLTVECVPVAPPSEKFHIFRFPSAHVDYLRTNGERQFGLTTSWPAVEVLSQVSPGVAATLVNTKKYKWQYRLTPVASPTFRVRPMLLFWLAVGTACLATLAALVLAARWYRVLRPRRAAGGTDQGSTLERALELLAWAHEHGDETLQRKAFERVGDELGVVPAVDELSQAAKELAWSPRLPEDEEVEAFAEQAREKGREP
jgi:hypothetical protein